MVRLIRGFVFGESDILIDSEYGVFCFKTSYRRIGFRDPDQNGSDKHFECVKGILVCFLVIIKPVAVVVSGEVLKKRKSVFHDGFTFRNVHLPEKVQ